MRKADHLHLRCPGNIGLLACLVQVLFPSKPKTAKYAGNWDPKAKQPRSYRFQKWLLSNTFLTRNMQVLVYGDWPGQSKNIKPFFTATYRDEDKEAVRDRSFVAPWRFVFAGTLSPGKQPVYVAQLLASLGAEMDWTLDFYGEGEMREGLEEFIFSNGLSNRIQLHGNVPQQKLKKAMSRAHCLVLPSLSEGWPKVVAEAMWWGCIPLALPVSCVPWMLEEGDRGLLLSGDLLDDVQRLQKLLSGPQNMSKMAENGVEWSRHYTLDLFELEIQKLLG